MELQRHEIWSIFPNTETLEKFQKHHLNEVYLKPEVPEAIRAQSIVIERLLLHSYYEYEFIDIALTQAVFLFEKALRIKWQQIYQKPTKLTLEKLIDWFFERGYFETRNFALPTQLRNIRNGKVHDIEKSTGGTPFINKTYATIDLINDLYETPVLRLMRTAERDKLNQELAEFMKDGAILTLNYKRFIAFQTHAVLISNKYPETLLEISVCPIFDLVPFEEGKEYIPGHFKILLKKWNWESNSFNGIDADTNQQVLLSKINDSTNQERFSQWQTTFFNLENWSLALFIASEPVEKAYTRSLRQLHKQAI